jgi:hypothetical protein
MKDVKREAKRRKIQLIVVPTSEAIQALRESPTKLTQSCTSRVHWTKCRLRFSLFRPTGPVR